MTVREWFKFGKSIRGDVKQFVVLFVLLSILDNLLTCRGESLRESRKLFGGYRITPTHCKASRAAKYNRGNTICMFNHECVQRGGEVVGACMDGFLFGACCQLKSDSQSHIPKGPGVVMTSYLDYPEAESDTADYESENLDAWHNSFKPVVTPGYRPGVSSSPKPDGNTESVISDGLTQITNTLLNSPEKENNYIFKPERPGTVYTHSTIDHNLADTILLNKNGSIADNVARPSDFNIQISSMQTKPTVSPLSTSTTPTSKVVSTHRPVYTKPVFKPKPKPQASSTENYIMVSTVTKENPKVTELSSIDSIIQMLNNTPSLSDEITSPSSDMAEHKSSLGSTVSSWGEAGYGSNYINYYVSPGHYVTVKPGTSLYSTTSAYIPERYTTPKPQNKTPISSTIHTLKPVSVYSSTHAYYTKKPYTPNSIPEVVKTTARPQYSSPSSASQSTQQAIDAFNNYPTDPSNFGPSLTTFTYVTSSTTPAPPSSTRSPSPPYTSYITGSTPAKRPVTERIPIQPNIPGFADNFATATPTVVILNNFQTPKPDTEESEEIKETEFIEISQEPFQKPASSITVNNVIETSNHIYLSKPPPLKHDRPSSPTVVITPKPPPNTTPYPIKSTTKYTASTPSFESFTEYTPTTFKPEMQTSPDDLINFPPVRNPMLNVTGSNAIFNTSITMSNDLEVLHDVEFTTPSWQEDEKLNEKMNQFVNKIVGSLQGTFQELHDIVILDKKPNATIINTRTTPKPTKKTPTTTKKPITTTKKPARLTTTTKKPLRTTKKPTKLTTVYRRPTTTALPTTTSTSAKKPVTTTKKPKPTKKVTTTIATTTVTEASNDEVTTEGFIDNTIDYNDKNLCGVRPLVKSGRIVGGKNAKFGEWPWQVLVRESTWLGLFTKNKCGGVLITSRFVTTAAHCQPGFLASLVAVFGENDISGDKEPRRPVSRNVRRVIVHRQYDAATFENDLALLELESPVKFDAHIVPICMPPDNSDFTGRMATVTGWGRLKYGGGVPAVLQEVQVPVIENSACQEMFLTAGHQKNIRKSFICAGYANGQKDSCEGDSGGPLVLQRSDGRWQLVGTVSHGIRCAAPFLPGVYMRTSFYKPWLASVAGVRG
ncbi:serine protease filzig [Plodia interpunctella]|uniref:serine protease filzig n=1 Tax=Plodia interpunctella TaxID=58824 RepID=UPI002367B569|nr:serine protease filzig [Plodia interpunctella]